MTTRVATLAPQKLVAILAVTLLLLAGATWLILISPKQSKESSLETTIASAKTQLAQLSNNASAAHKHAVSESLLLGRALPNETAMPQIVLQLSRIATEEHVSLDSITPQTPVSYSGYQAVPLTITLTGTFFAVESFLQQLRNQVQVAGSDVAATGRLYDVRGVTLQSTDPAPKVTATVMVDAFSYTGIAQVRPRHGDDGLDTLMAPGADRAGRAAQREAQKARRQKIFVGVGGGLLLVVVGFVLLPGLVGSSSGSWPGHGAVPASVAVPVARSTRGGSGGPSSPVPKDIARLARRDVFAPQVSAAGTGLGAGPAERILKGPAVRAKHFVSKDPFIAQVKPPAATPASSSVPTPQDGGSGSASPGASGGSGYIVVLSSIPGISTASRQAAARAVVAAKNAGLKDVVANDAVPGTSGAGPHFTVYTGPYEFESTAQTELVRALRNGYPRAVARQLPGSTGKGF